jgi:valyl-tRNA synthetase
VTPLFHVPVPIMADPKADPEKGTGIVMVCTFGDQTDVEWWREFNLPVRQVLDRDGPSAAGEPLASDGSELRFALGESIDLLP